MRNIVRREPCVYMCACVCVLLPLSRWAMTTPFTVTRLIYRTRPRNIQFEYSKRGRHFVEIKFNELQKKKLEEHFYNNFYNSLYSWQWLVWIHRVYFGIRIWHSIRQLRIYRLLRNKKNFSRVWGKMACEFADADCRNMVYDRGKGKNKSSEINGEKCSEARKKDRWYATRGKEGQFLY